MRHPRPATGIRKEKLSMDRVINLVLAALALWAAVNRVSEALRRI
jgi:hypothetical protein